MSESEFTFNCSEITLLTEKYTQSICNEAKETICSYFFNSKSILASKRCHRWRPSKGAMDAITTIDWEEREKESERGILESIWIGEALIKLIKVRLFSFFTSSFRKHLMKRRTDLIFVRMFVLTLGKLKTKPFLIFLLVLVYVKHVVKCLQSVNLRNNCKENLLL